MLQAKVRWNNVLSLRAEVERVRHQLALPKNLFRPLGPREWPSISKNIYHAFCQLDSYSFMTQPTWLWEHFKLESYAWYQPNVLPDFLLEKLIEEQETVWLMLNSTLNENNKFWLYEGHISAIRQLISECCYIDEIYVISKKYEWLLCINHHNVLCATGGDMPAKLRRLEATIA